MLMRFHDEKTGETHRLFDTVELSSDLQIHGVKFDCLHTETEIRRRSVGGGAVQVSRQCTKCGRAIGGAIKRSPTYANLSPFDECIEGSFDAARKANYRRICLKHLDLQRKREASHQKEYDAYLRSPEWAAKRQKVLERAHGICEGCLQECAEQVHHLTYRHIFNEFMFELVALCKSCHERYHDGEAEIGITDAEDGLEPLCSACRWQDEKGDIDWCGKFDISRQSAMADNGACGPNQSEFEGLR